MVSFVSVGSYQVDLLHSLAVVSLQYFFLLLVYIFGLRWDRITVLCLVRCHVDDVRRCMVGASVTLSRPHFLST